VTNTIYALSYWYLPTTNANRFTVRFNSAARPENILTPPPPSPPVLPTPGAVNQAVAALPPFPPLWLSEVQPINASTRADNFGDFDPWIELHNAGTTNLPLEGFTLANSFFNLWQWTFPAGVVLPPGEFLVVWADAQPAESAGTNLHASFRLDPANGTVVLSRGGLILDYLNYSVVGTNRSFGAWPADQASFRQVFDFATPGGANDPSAVPVTLFINEWMASNTSFITDPNNEFDDWFEIYNPTTNAVDLAGFHLSDDPTNNPTKFTVPAGISVPARGFLLVWTDEQSGQTQPGGDLHVNFKLSQAGEAIALYDPNGRPIDSVTFGPQTNNISEGRWPDGGASLYFMLNPTPRAANVIPGGNTPPQLASIADRTIRLGQAASFTATAIDAQVPPQTLTFSLGGTVPFGAFINAAGQFSWTPTLAQTPSTNTFTVYVTDNGVGALSDSGTFKITVRSPPVAMITGHGGTSVTVGFDTIPGRSYRLYFKARIDDATWLPLSGSVQATGASLTIDDNIGANVQRFYRVFEVN